MNKYTHLVSHKQHKISTKGDVFSEMFLDTYLWFDIFSCWITYFNTGR